MMRLGVDARSLSQELTGIGRYTLELSKALLRRVPDMRFYAPTPLSSEMAELLKANRIKDGKCQGRLGRMLWSQTQLPRWAAQDDLDVFWGPTHRLPEFLPERMAKVVTIHDLVWKYAGGTMRKSSRVMERWLMPKAVAKADMILADSLSTAQGIAETFPDAEEKTRVVHLGMTPLPEQLPAEKLQALGIESGFILFVGTLEPRKNLKRLLTAYSKLPEVLKQQHPLVIAGGQGWGGIDVTQLLGGLNLRSYVRVVGYVDDALLATLYANALFVAMPSLYEGFGLPLVEAMSFGKAVLVGAGSLPEVAGLAGIVIDPLDETSIEQGLLYLCDATKRSQQERYALSRAESFTWDKAAEQSYDVFCEAIERAKTRR